MADYDAAVIGAGPGGYVAAIRAAQLGAKTCIIENRELGGTCLNRGCIPTKIYLHVSDVLREGKSASDYGLSFGEPTVDYGKLNEKRDKIIGGLRKGIAGLLKKNSVDVIEGKAAFESAHTLKIETADGQKKISAENIIIATGSEAARPKFFPIDGRKIITSDEILDLDHVPESLLVVGGGYIGAEYGGFFSQMGTQVTIVEMLDQILPMNDLDVAQAVVRAFKKSKMKIITSAKVEDLKATDSGISCKVGDKTIEAELALVAIGRKMNSDVPGLEDAGIEVENGAIVIDDTCKTTVDGVYAIGDVTGKVQLAHVASAQGIVAAENITGHPRTIDYRVVPSVFFTHPQVAAVGITEKQAAGQQLDVKVATFQFRGLGKAQVIGDTGGFVKLIGNAKTGELLGCQIVGPSATELIEEAAVA
ncbi:MAG: dihydrolipoyl dehydrogenase, partial [Planctomycetes bacterium]|nr:dihydrolipoyl dehydrogenase [Planctomycetota bacterium]